MEIKVQLVSATAREVESWLNPAMHELCNGCYFDHPSQIQHECLMLEGEERIRFCIYKALDMLDWKKVSQDWWQHLSVAHQIACPRHCGDIDWLRHVWRDTDMKKN